MQQVYKEKGESNMKHLVIYSHPNPKSFNNAILEKVTKTLEDQGQEVRVRDLYQLNFNPVLSANDFEAIQAGTSLADVKIEQDYISWADVVIVIYPVWWAEMPAILKGYIDRVFSSGFAYGVEGTTPIGYLKGKKVVMLSTTGSPEEHYHEIGMFAAMRKIANEGTFEFCGMEVLKHNFYTAVTMADESKRQMYLDDVEMIMKELA